MNQNWQNMVEQRLQSTIQRMTSVKGGDFAEAFRGVLADGRCVFIKTHTQPPAHFFSTEAAGLVWLRERGRARVPKVLVVSDDPPLLVLTWIEQGEANTHTEVEFGRLLAQLHQADYPLFGRLDQRTTGSQALPNNNCPSWSEFYATQRLLPLAEKANDAKVLSTKDINRLESVANRLAELAGPLEPPALLHGDLWAGNRLIDRQGKSWLIDPAAYGGHREFDLAMMRLFGGFEEACFSAYQEVFPLGQAWQERIALHQLAPLVVHAIKFGGSYVASVRNVLRQYS